MTIKDYESQGGFRSELNLVRDMGMALTSLTSMIPTRPYRLAEQEALETMKIALDNLRREILETRNS